MIDFQNSELLKLKPIGTSEGHQVISPMLISGEEAVAAFKTVRDMIVFTNKRIITVNVQGMTGSKKDFTSLPYNKIQAFSIETSGTFDLDCEMVLFFSGLGKVKFEFRGNFDIRTLNQLISSYIL